MESSMITALRGFKVRPGTLDRYLAANGDDFGTQNGSFPPPYEFDDNGAASDIVLDILRSRLTAIKSDDDISGILLVVPSGGRGNRSPWVYVAYSHAFIYSQRLITSEILPEHVPRGFEELRREILEYSSSRDPGDEGLMGFYIVFTFDRSGPLPAEIQKRRVPPFICEVCEHISEDFLAKQWHRMIVHRIGESDYPLPENV